VARLTRGTRGKDGIHTMFELDFSSNAEALVAILLVAAITVVAFV
jgi:hypothetical protein